jgi:hypothetical protein
LPSPQPPSVMTAAAHSKKQRLDRARRRKLNGKNGFVANPYSALPARPNALINDTVRSDHSAFRLQFGAPQIRRRFKPKPAGQPGVSELFLGIRCGEFDAGGQSVAPDQPAVAPRFAVPGEQ